MFQFDYCNKIEDYLKKLVITVDTFNDIASHYSLYHNPKLYYIRDIAHVIVVFPNGCVFNCNPRDYPLNIVRPLSVVSYGIQNEQIEPSSMEYETYWYDRWDKLSVVSSAIEFDKNCGLWSAYYLWWFEKKTGQFPSSLADLENWIQLVCNDYLNNNKELFIQ